MKQLNDLHNSSSSSKQQQLKKNANK